MQRISSNFFMLALLTYYVPKMFKMRKSKYIKVHIITGLISSATMIIALFSKIGQVDFLKYVGFTAIMAAIAVSGYLIKRKSKFYLNVHRISTIMFFIYLFIAIKIF